MNDNNILKIIDENGVEKEYEILIAYKWNKTGKHYIAYTDNSTDENGNKIVEAAIYYPDDDTRLDPIETEEEWNEIERRLKVLK